LFIKNTIFILDLHYYLLISRVWFASKLGFTINFTR